MEPRILRVKCYLWPKSLKADSKVRNAQNVMKVQIMQNPCCLKLDVEMYIRNDKKPSAESQLNRKMPKPES